MDSALSHLGDVPLEIDAAIACQPLTAEQILNLRPGSLIKSLRAAGDSVDVRVGQQLVCQGEIVVFENKLAVRLSDFEETS